MQMIERLACSRLSRHRRNDLRVEGVCLMAMDNLGRAFDFVARHGGISTNVDELLKRTPLERELTAAADHCHREVDQAIQLIREHYKMAQKITTP